jgi:cytochrome c oxidase subunit 2
MVVSAVSLLASPLNADQPRPWQIDLQAPASPLAERIGSFNDLLNFIIIAISALVLALLAWVIVRYRERTNPIPSKTTHNTLVEVIWTLVPALILALIAVPSFRLLYYADKAADPTITIKARGHQWYWSYIYDSSLQVDDAGKPVVRDGKPVDNLADARFVFESRIACRGDADANDKKACADFAQVHKRPPVRLLDVDNAVVIPVGTEVRMLVIGMDVIHAWGIPSMGAKVDAVPGRVNETWIYARRPGIYYGQCSELCGRDHAFMPIAVRAVPRAEYEAWLTDAKTRFDKVEEPRRAAAASPAGSSGPAR